MEKFALFPFNGEMMCFVHVLLNALDMKKKGHEVAIVVEGAATKLIPELAKESAPMHKLYAQCKEQGLFAGACKACSKQMGVLDAIKAEGLELLDDMMGHPGMAGFADQGYTVITF